VTAGVQRTFTPDDQAAFARLSGDYNPLHLDAIAARRLLFGSPVVHGIHALLWALDALAPDAAPEGLVLQEVKAVFKQPIPVGELALLEPQPVPARADGAGAIKARILVNGTAVTTLSAVFSRGPASPGARRLPEPSFPARIASRLVPDGELLAQRGELPLHLDPETATSLFPRLGRVLATPQLASLLATSAVVGVHCPGVHSIFSELALHADNETRENNSLAFAVSRLDERFNLVTLAVASPGLSGQLYAFRRPDACVQPAYARFRAAVGSREFAHCRALVVGGSRGLGEVSVKLLCAGGADVRFTYHLGAGDAEAMVSDIRAAGGNVAALAYDACTGTPGTLLTDNWLPTHVLYFPTPPIFTGRQGVFSKELFLRFCDYYVHGFYRVFASLYPRGTLRYFLPSSSAIDELPPDMGEYVAAKQAAEAAAKILEKSHRGVVIDQERLPRLATDQTMSLAGGDEGDPLPAMLHVLRRFTQDVASAG